MDGFFVWRNFDALDALQLFDAALHLLGFGGLVAKAVDEDFQLLDALTLVAIGRFKLLEALGLRTQILFVVAVIKMNPLVPDLGNLVDGDVEEIAVVRDEDEGIGVIVEVVFEPVAGFEVEVVGGLVEE